MECRLQLLIRSRQLDRDIGDEQDPECAVKHQRRTRISEEQADAEHNPRHRNWRRREEAEQLVATHRLARDEI